MKRLSTCLILSLLFALPPVLCAYDPEAWTSFPNMNYVTSLAEGESHIFVATTGGIRRYDRFAERWLSPLTMLDGLPDNRVENLVYDVETGDLWFDTPAGSARWLSRLEVISLTGIPPTALQRARPRSKIPPVFPPFGYFVEDTLVRGPRRTYGITDATIDSWRILWIGTWGLGVGRADMRDEQLKFHQSGPLDANVTAIAQDGEDIWFGGEDTHLGPARGITRYRPSSGTWEYFEADQILGLDDARVSVILPDSADVWFGTQLGLARYIKKEGQWLTYRLPVRDLSRITALARDGDRLWIGTDNGLVVFRLKANTIRRVEGSEQFVIHAMAAGPGYIWAGTDYGLYRCPRRDVTWSPVHSPEGLTGNRVRALTVRGREVWAALDSPPGLLHLPAPGSAWERIPLAEIGGSRSVAVAADSSRVWVATDLGGFRFDIARGLWKHYTRSDGLIHDRAQAVLLDGGYVWFGTVEGVSRFHWAGDFFETGR